MLTPAVEHHAYQLYQTMVTIDPRPEPWRTTDRCLSLSVDDETLAVVFPKMLTPEVQNALSVLLVDYARNGWLTGADHTKGAYQETINPDWKGDKPLAGVIYLSRARHMIGHPTDTSIASADLVGSSFKFQKGMQLLADLAPLATLANYLIKLVDEAEWERMRKIKEAMIKARPDVRSICCVDPGLHHTLGLVFNRRSGPHKDSFDVRKGWAVMFTTGSFTGGELEFPEHHVKVAFGPGTAVVLRAYKLKHAIGEWNGRLRITAVYYSDQSVYNEFGFRD